MKNLFLIALALVTLQVGAQNDKPNFRKGDRMQRAERFNDFSPEEMAELQTKRLTLRLDLTEAQQKEVQKLQLENAKERKARMEARQARKQDGTGPKLSKEEKLALANDRLDRQIEMKKKMKQILNDDQYAKWEMQMERRQDRPQGKRPGNPGGKQLKRQ